MIDGLDQRCGSWGDQDLLDASRELRASENAGAMF